MLEVTPSKIKHGGIYKTLKRTFQWSTWHRITIFSEEAVPKMIRDDLSSWNVMKFRRGFFQTDFCKFSRSIYTFSLIILLWLWKKLWNTGTLLFKFLLFHLTLLKPIPNYSFRNFNVASKNDLALKELDLDVWKLEKVIDINL